MKFSQMSTYRTGIIIVFLLFPLHFFAMTQKEAENARKNIVSYAKQFIGVPYVTGGISSTGMDCSGFLFTVSRESTGVQLPRTVSAMYADMRIVPLSKLEAGDAIFFRTVGKKISHVGLYIGKNQFIHSISDGPNTGVIVSSLNQTTWNNTFAAVGQFLPSTRKETQKKTTFSIPSLESINLSKKNTFADKLTFDISALFMWNFLSKNSFMFNARGADIDFHASWQGFDKKAVIPGIGIRIHVDSFINVTQIPIVLTATIYDSLRIYAGPVFTIGTPVIAGSAEQIKASFFPGILGIAWLSPSWDIGPVSMCFTQHITWTVYNNLNNAALNAYDSISTGITFSTGFCVTFPVKNFIK